MSDYDKAMKIQELRDERLDLMWDYIVADIVKFDFKATDERIKQLDKQIKELQNG